MSLRRFFDTDMHDETVCPDMYYEVVLHPRGGERQMTEYVSGEDLLACAEFVDQMLSQGEEDDT